MSAAPQLERITLRDGSVITGRCVTEVKNGCRIQIFGMRIPRSAIRKLVYSNDTNPVSPGESFAGTLVLADGNELSGSFRLGTDGDYEVVDHYLLPPTHKIPSKQVRRVKKKSIGQVDLSSGQTVRGTVVDTDDASITLRNIGNKSVGYMHIENTRIVKRESLSPGSQTGPVTLSISSVFASSRGKGTGSTGFSVSTYFGYGLLTDQIGFAGDFSSLAWTDLKASEHSIRSFSIGITANLFPWKSTYGYFRCSLIGGASVLDGPDFKRQFGPSVTFQGDYVIPLGPARPFLRSQSYYLAGITRRSIDSLILAGIGIQI